MANKGSELEQIITDLVILIGCNFQVVHKLVIGDDFLHFTIANTKNIPEVWDSFPFCLLNDLNPFSGDRIPSTTPGAEPPRDAKDSGSARSHSTHLETSSSDRP